MTLLISNQDKASESSAAPDFRVKLEVDNETTLPMLLEGRVSVYVLVTLCHKIFDQAMYGLDSETTIFPDSYDILFSLRCSFCGRNNNHFSDLN
mmetsp:Transcript_6851/g.12942  ORF Transcript_6851/g.12942 Transcript_6851/m.12942 type:complete len:94 (+) Transcript_6851:99-380(+)